MKRLSNILKESLFGNMSDKGRGEVAKKEDDINHLDLDGLWDYINSNYEIIPQAMPLKSKNDTYAFISLPAFWVRYKLYRVDFKFKDDKIVEIQFEANEIICSEFIDIIKEKYDVDNCGGFGMIKIYSKTDKLTNKDAIDIIDIVISNTKNPALKKITNESLFGNMSDKGRGEVVKKEDDINNLNGEELKEYITSHYKSLNNFAIVTYSIDILSVPIIRDTVNSCIMYFPSLSIDINKICITNAITDKVKGLTKLLYDNFSVKESYGEDSRGEYTIYSIFPKDGSEVTNKFFIEVLDFILDNIHDTSQYKKSIEKISKIS